MSTIIRNIGYAIPTVLLGLVYWGDSYRHPEITTLIFLGLMTLWAVLMRVGEGHAKPCAFDSGWWAKGAVSWWIRVGAILAGGLLLLLLSDQTYQGMRLYPRQTKEFYWAVKLCFFLLIILVVRPPRPIVSLVFLVLAGMLIRACGLWQWDINPNRRDMLALVISACDAFLSGENPYAFHQMQVGSQVPLTYPPGLWLAHLPAHILGVDIRWTGVIADGIAAGAIGAIALRAKVESRGAVFAALAVYLFLPDIHWNGIYAEPNFDWAVIACFGAAVMVRKPMLAAGIMGFSLATRPFNLVLLPFFVIWALRRYGVRNAWRMVAITGLTAAVFYLPFVLADPDIFYVGTVRWLLEYGSVHSRWFWGMLGFSGILYKHGLVHWMLPAQLASVLLLVGFATWRLRTERDLLVFSTFVYAAFVAFNSIIWMSFWVGVCVLAIAAMGATPSQAGRFKQELPRGHVWNIVFVAAGAISVLSAAILVILLGLHFDTSGREEARAYLESNAKSGDMILDKTGWRVAFLKMPFVLGQQSAPKGVVVARDPFSAVSPRKVINPLGFKSVFVVERYGLFSEDKEVFFGAGKGASPFEQVDMRVFGRYKVIRLKRQVAQIGERLSKDVGALKVVVKSGKSQIKPIWNNGWIFKGASWKQVISTRARFKRTLGRLIAAHPRDKATLTIETSVPDLAKWITVFGGLRDKAPQWDMASVRMKIVADGDLVKKIEFSNYPGLHGCSVLLPRRTQNVAFELGTDKQARRNFYFDAVFSR